MSVVIVAGRLGLNGSGITLARITAHYTYREGTHQMSEPTLEDNVARGLDDEPFLSSCYYCDTDIYIYDQRFRYCEQCKKEGK